MGKFDFIRSLNVRTKIVMSARIAIYESETLQLACTKKEPFCGNGIKGNIRLGTDITARANLFCSRDSESLYTA